MDDVATRTTDPYAVDMPISLAKRDSRQWIGEAMGISEPFIEPEDPIRESIDGNPRPQFHVVRVDAAMFDDEAWPMGNEMFRFPNGATMPNRPTMTPMDDYRLVFDGSHA